MALPQATKDLLDNVAEAEAEDARKATLAGLNKTETVAETKTVTETETAVAEEVKGTPAAIGQAVQAIALANDAKSATPLAFLESLGITDVKIDFTSFPTITLNNEVFSTDEHKAFGTEFECVYMHKMDLFLYKGDLGRDKDPELVYSSDGIVCNKEGKPMTEYIDDWKARNIPYDRKEYTMVVVQMVDTDHAGDICQIQVSPASRGKLGGYLLSLGLKKIDPTSVVTKVSIGPAIGSGLKEFTPFVFKQVK